MYNSQHTNFDVKTNPDEHFGKIFSRKIRPNSKIHKHVDSNWHNTRKTDALGLHDFQRIELRRRKSDSSWKAWRLSGVRRKEGSYIYIYAFTRLPANTPRLRTSLFPIRCYYSLAWIFAAPEKRYCVARYFIIIEFVCFNVMFSRSVRDRWIGFCLQVILFVLRVMNKVSGSRILRKRCNCDDIKSPIRELLKFTFSAVWRRYSFWKIRVIVMKYEKWI